jgi:hypothetical protein
VGQVLLYHTAQYPRRLVIFQIQVLCREENILVSIDKRTDASGRKFANVIGVLKHDQSLSDKQFILSCKEMSAVNRCGQMV